MKTQSAQNGNERWIREAVVCAGVIVAAWYFVHLRYSLNQEFPLATLSSFLDGTAYRPFQFRMLIPWLVGGFQATGLSEMTLYRIFDALSVVGIFYSFRYYLSGFIDRRRGIARSACSTRCPGTTCRARYPILLSDLVHRL
jgi:hypothetical protein